MRSSTSAVEFSASAVSASAATVCGSQTGRSQQPRYDGSHDEEGLQVRHDVLLSLFYRSSGLGRRTSVGPEIGSGGAYQDELVKVGGQWLFRYRKIDRFIAP